MLHISGRPLHVPSIARAGRLKVCRFQSAGHTNQNVFVAKAGYLPPLVVQCQLQLCCSGRQLATTRDTGRLVCIGLAHWHIFQVRVPSHMSAANFATCGAGTNQQARGHNCNRATVRQIHTCMVYSRHRQNVDGNILEVESL